MKLYRNNLTMKVLSKFIENNLDKIEGVETKSNEITLKTVDGIKKVKVRTSKNHIEEELPNVDILWTKFSSKELEEDYSYMVVICSEDTDKAIVFTKEELKEHYSLEQKKKKNGEIDFNIYPVFIGRRCFYRRGKFDKEGIDITKYVNNYVL